MAPVFSEGSSVNGVRRPLHRGSSVWIEAHTVNTSAKWCSSRSQQLEEVSVQGSVQSGIYFETFSSTGLFRDPVCHAGDWEGVRPWPRPLPADRGLDGADDRTPDEETCKEKWSAPLKAGERPNARRPKARYIASTMTNGFGVQPELPEYSVHLSTGNCPSTPMHTAPSTSAEKTPTTHHQ